MPSFLRVAPFALAIFLAAFLIFVVQPLVGKRILPWFGGASGVWSLCLAFYQTALFFGYVYAHALSRFVPVRSQPLIHGVVLLAAIGSLPILPGIEYAPSNSSAPEFEILRLLVLKVALPFMALAATGPLVQSWFALRETGRSPYALYAVSNLGSLIGLLGYPFFLEPHFALESTGRFWSGAFVLCSILVLATGGLASMGDRPPAPVVPAASRSGTRTGTGTSALVWALLAGSAVILLNGLTNELTLDVASVPFLWVSMLAAYLMSFILAFASERCYSRVLFLPATAILVLLVDASPLVANEFFSADGSSDWAFGLDTQIALYVGLLFCASMTLHGELYRLRPGALDLTRFYVFVSGGGAIGGLFVGLLAPRLFDAFHEVAIGLAIGFVTLLFVWLGIERPDAARPRLRSLAAILGALLVLGPEIGQRIAYHDPLLAHRERGFFGVLRVRELESSNGIQRQLMHGTTQHGIQLQGPGFEKRPTAYYGVHTGIGFALRQRSVGPPLDVGIVGLGIGTLAAYGRPGDTYHFFEIDPAITRIARDDGSFSYLALSDAQIEISEGDARLVLERGRTRNEAPFDVLVVDAFTSDAIPLHLLTQEAFRLYDARLAERGLLALHVSNRHFELEKVIARIGHSIGYDALLIQNRKMPRFLSERSKWIFLSREPDILARLARFSETALRSRGLAASNLSLSRFVPAELESTALWTDDYSDILSTRAKDGNPL